MWGSHQTENVRKITFSVQTSTRWNIFPLEIQWALTHLAFCRALKTQESERGYASAVAMLNLMNGNMSCEFYISYNAF